jgi:flagellar capping protein FliD
MINALQATDAMVGGFTAGMAAIRRRSEERAAVAQTNSFVDTYNALVRRHNHLAASNRTWEVQYASLLRELNDVKARADETRRDYIQLLVKTRLGAAFRKM